MSDQTTQQDPQEAGTEGLAEFTAPGNAPVETAVQETFGTDAPAPPETIDRSKKLDLLYDLALPVSIELGRTNMLIKDILDLKRGSIIEFEKMTSEPVDILINGKKMAEGEVVVIEKHFGIRITNLIEAADRVRGLGK